MLTQEGRQQELLEESQQTLMQQQLQQAIQNWRTTRLHNYTDIDHMTWRPCTLNDRTQLMGGIADDAEWQARINSLIVLNNQQYDRPRGRVSTNFLTLLTE